VPPFLLDIVYGLLLLLGLPFVIYKTLTSERFRAGWGERLGGVAAREPKQRFWVHCASVGEVLLAQTLIRKLEQEYPKAEVVLSTITNTGRATAEKNLPGHPVFYFPLDFSFIVRKVLRRIKPTAIILVELEVWPNFIRVAKREGIPVVVVNGRITERSARRYARSGWFWRPVFRRVEHYAVQNREYGERLESLGVPKNRITQAGTMKYDTVSTEIHAQTVAKYQAALHLKPSDTVVFGGCTHPGEDELLIDYFKQRLESGERLRLVLAPRHSTRIGAVRQAIEAAGLACVQKTDLDAGRAAEDFENRPHVLLVDTTGELAGLYAVATVVFVGGSLIEHGGQNMMEPAALGKAVCFGPHTWNFRDTVEMLLRHDAAVQLDGPDQLAPVLDDLCRNVLKRHELGIRAQQAVIHAKGATERNFNAISSFLCIMADTITLDHGDFNERRTP
jgi:3-deoxy-D-manno-octulosonic-acid transferase